MSIEIRGVTPLLQVFNMPVSLRFYRDLLGFEATRMSRPLSDNPDDVGWAMLEGGGASVMLNTAYDPDARPDRPDPGRWSGHQDAVLFIGCPEVTAAYEYLIRKGLDLEPPSVQHYGMRQIHLKDPDGFGICLQWRV